MHRNSAMLSIYTTRSLYKNKDSRLQIALKNRAAVKTAISLVVDGNPILIGGTNVHT